jgi:ceramide glucosyltransferase
MVVLSWFGILLAMLAALGIVYQIFAVLMLRRFFSRRPPATPSTLPVTILKPLKGDEPNLEANLATFLAQEHAGPLQLLCGVQCRSDPAIAVVKSLRRKHPESEIDLVVDPSTHGVNAKIANLLNMAPSARYGTLVLSDSDMAVARDYLPTLLATLAKPGIGAATCLYRGRADNGLWSHLAAGAISYCAMPAIVVGLSTGMARPCMGSTIAMSRETLAAVGGFERFTDVLADDHALGAAIASTGDRVEVPGILLVHACAEDSIGALWRHQIRWSVTIRKLAPAGYAGSIITNPLPLALLASAIYPAPGLGIAAACLCVRALTAVSVDRIAGERSTSPWLLPLIDCFEFLVFVANFFVRTIDWRGSKLTIANDGRIMGE